MGLILITHDLGVVADVAERILVMYAGRTMERGSVDEIYANTANPYTYGLLRSIPKIDQRVQRLPAIKGLPPSLFGVPDGCAFNPRCPKATDQCRVGCPAGPAGGRAGPPEPLLVRARRCWPMASSEPVRVIEATNIVQSLPDHPGHPVQEADRQRPGGRRRDPVPQRRGDAGHRGRERLRQVHDRSAAHGPGGPHLGFHQDQWAGHHRASVAVPCAPSGATSRSSCRTRTRP